MKDTTAREKKPVRYLLPLDVWAHIAKPLDIEKMIMTIREVLNNGRT